MGRKREWKRESPKLEKHELHNDVLDRVAPLVEAARRQLSAGAPPREARHKSSIESFAELEPLRGQPLSSSRARVMHAAQSLFAEAHSQGERLDIYTATKESIVGEKERQTIALFTQMPEKEFFVERSRRPTREEATPYVKMERDELRRAFISASAQHCLKKVTDTESRAFKETAHMAHVLKVIEDKTRATASRYQGNRE